MVAYQIDWYRIPYLDNASFQPSKLKLVQDSFSECEISRNTPYIWIRPSYDFSNSSKIEGWKSIYKKSRHSP